LRHSAYAQSSSEFFISLKIIQTRAMRLVPWSEKWGDQATFLTWCTYKVWGPSSQSNKVGVRPLPLKLRLWVPIFNEWFTETMLGNNFIEQLHV